MQTRRADEVQLKTRWRLFTFFRDSAIKSARHLAINHIKMLTLTSTSILDPTPPDTGLQNGVQHSFLFNMVERDLHVSKWQAVSH